ncbi:hypothetical protein GCM10011491_32480 [Brucella endophytica]|uniref:Cytochrome C oxidase subunit IV n=1 Tax=Brucella endophytica TaxID=1963359 RepID=A0A916SIH9_9HYPH|nr:cytochrome C oxidase subunit IV family protein [Brucella endophytica]GGB01794.1 hypothetical protein GCM10011491_32480 [Brucella endophytica]
MPFDLARVWGLLVALSLFTLTISFSSWPVPVANIVILALAIAKARFILLDFLELRHVPAYWRALFWWWLCLICAAALATSFWTAYAN